MGTRAASRSAVLVCQGRAVAHGRVAPGRFDDPIAMALLHDDERYPLERARGGVAPKGWADRVELKLMAANAKGTAVRTVAIDDAVRARTNPQLVVLGAAGHRADVPTTWIWEGVVPYLAPADVEATTRAVAERSAAGSRLVVHYAEPSRTATLAPSQPKGPKSR